MTAHRPEELHSLFVAALSAFDLDAVMSLYDDDATLVASPEQVIQGSAAIRLGLAGYLATRPIFELQSSKVIQSGKVALMFSEWVITVTDTDGVRTQTPISPIQVACQQRDGTWRIAIDNPPGKG